MNRNASAFSLVELSIVLVILGLLTGGILAGQSLIRASELRAVSSEYSRYATAMMAFRDKYFLFPGDFNRATAVWGVMTTGTGCTNRTGAADATSTASGTCDGNGDGMLAGAASGASSEYHQFWRQLSLAGLIEGSYSGITGTGGNSHCRVGTDCPTSKLNNAGWDLYYYGHAWAGDGQTYVGNYGNAMFVFGAGNSTTIPESAALRQAEAWNIDSKLDDGMPGRGKIIARFWNDACATSTTNIDYAGTYKLTDNTVRCSLYFRQLF